MATQSHGIQDYSPSFFPAVRGVQLTNSQIEAQRRTTARLLQALTRCQSQSAEEIDAAETDRFLRVCGGNLQEWLADAAALNRTECLLFYIPIWAYQPTSTYPIALDALRKDYRDFLSTLGGEGHSVDVRFEALKWGQFVGHNRVMAVYVQVRPTRSETLN